MRRLTGAAITIGIAVAVFAAPAGAKPTKLHASSISVKAFDLSGTVDHYSGGFVGCPGTRKAFGGAGYWYDPMNAVSSFDAGLTAAIPDKGLNGVDGSGFAKYAGLVLRVEAFCAPRSKLKGAHVKKTTLPGPDSGNEPYLSGARVRCPSGERAIGGGASWHPPGGGPPSSGTAGLFERAYIASSVPTVDGKGWYAMGADGWVGDGQVFTVEVVCIDAKRLGKVKAVHATRTVNTGNTGGQTVECPKQMRILAGGAYFAQPGFSLRSSRRVDPPPETYSTAISYPFDNGKSWFANGANPGGPSRMQYTVQALCLAK
ncbi:hypothetical protein BH10ACT11_BH10ACT11_00510 [soil metagenome]